MPSGMMMRIGIGRNQTQIGVSAVGPFQIVDAQGKVLLDGAPNQVVTFTRVSVARDAQGKDIFMLQMNGQAGQLLALPLKVLPKADVPNNFARYKLKQWRGSLELVWNSQGGVSVVNVVPLEEYLRGVVPGEMPASWPSDALKAQAIVARTYAIANTRAGGKYPSEGFDLTDDTGSQVYGGVTAEETTSDAAVAATKGKIAVYQGKPISAFFFAASGGYTENNEIVWQGSPIPYLRGVKDYDQDAKWAGWTEERTMAQVSKGVLDSKKVDLGTLYDVRPQAPYGADGRPGNWELLGSGGSIKLNAEGLRWAAGLPSHASVAVAKETVQAPLTRTTADDQNVTVLTAAGTTEINLKTKAVMGGGNATATTGDKVTMAAAVQTMPLKVAFLGGGWGHRVGMSQWGARGMALLGNNAEQIVTHYFTGTQVNMLP